MIAQNYFWHYAVVMGENGTDDLSYEDYVAEDYEGGTGYSYDDPLYDIDEQPEPNSQLSGGNSQDDAINQILNNGNGADAFDMVNRDNDQNDNGDVGGGEYGAGGSTVGDDDFDSGEEEEEPDNFDGEDDVDDNDDDDKDDVDDSDDDDEDEEDDDDDEDGEFVDNKGSEQNRNEQQVKGKKRKDYEGVINWKPGEKITIELLGQIWDKCRVIDKIRSLIDAANNAVSQAMNALGPNLMLRLNAFVNKMIDATKDTISSLLDLASRTGKRMVYLTASTVEAIFDQQWTQTATIGTLPTVLKMALETDMVKSILNRIFKIAVPIINRAARKNN